MALRWLEPLQAAEPEAGAFRARQLAAVQRLTPLAVLANLLNALLLVTAFWSTPQRLFTLTWAAGIVGVTAYAWLGWRRARRRGPRLAASPRALRRSTLHAAALAGLWALVPLVLFPDAGAAHQLLVAVLTSGMMCAGGFALASTPRAGSAYVLILGAASGVALALSSSPMAWPIGGLLAVYTLFVLGTVWETARLFGARLRAEAEAEHRNEVIGLLLRDFEEHASDLLWEIDPRGRLRHVSPRLARLFGMAADELAATSVFAVLERLLPPDDSGAGQLEKLREQIRLGQPFRDLPLATERDGRARWWSLSAKPLFDAQQRLNGWRGVARDVTEAQHANRQLARLAHSDTLTGVANRHRFRGQLADLLLDLSSGDGSRLCALLCLDLDHFKTLNDTLGHAVGDALLQQVAQRLQAATRRSDTVARLGGDEFAVILNDVASGEEAGQLTQRLLEALQQPCEVLGARVAMGVSIGVALAPRDGAEVDTLLKNADVALYAAKSAGRGSVSFYAPQMAAQTQRRLQIDQALRGALQRGELSLVFLPQVDLCEWRVTGFEALLRWSHAVLGDVAPAEFVPVAEEAGLIPEIGDWVLVQACRAAARWPAGLLLSVNISPVQALASDIGRSVLAALGASALAPQRLELDVTEAIFLQQNQAAVGSLRALHEGGVRVALDDFGAGTSSLSYLRRFPFDTLKIDRSFVHELLQRADARAVVRMTVGLAAALRMRTVAEGVEEAGQADVLRRYGCQALQGFLVARPLPAEEIPAFLAAWSLQPRPQAPTPPLNTGAMPLGAAD